MEMVSSFIVVLYEIFNFLDEISDTPENTTFYSLFVQDRKPCFHLVHPGSTGRCKMHVKTFVLCKPSLHFLVLVSGIIVRNNVYLFIGANGSIDEIEKIKVFMMAMSFVIFAK